MLSNNTAGLNGQSLNRYSSSREQQMNSSTDLQQIIDVVPESSSISDKPSQQSIDLASSRFAPIDADVKVTLSSADLYNLGIEQNSIYSRYQIQGSQFVNTSTVNIADSNSAVNSSGENVKEIGKANSNQSFASVTQNGSKTDTAKQASYVQDNYAEELTSQEIQKLDSLKQRQAEVIRHEQAHAATGGGATGSPEYEYTTGPDGERYAINGEVSVNFSNGTPQQQLADAERIQRAALAPAEPSAQDRSVAREAAARARQAEADLENLEQSEIQEAVESEKSAINAIGASSDDFQNTQDSADTVKVTTLSGSGTGSGLAIGISQDWYKPSDSIDQLYDDQIERGFAGGSSFRAQNNVQDMLETIRTSTAQLNGNTNGISASRASEVRDAFTEYGLNNVESQKLLYSDDQITRLNSSIVQEDSYPSAMPVYKPDSFLRMQMEPQTELNQYNIDTVSANEGLTQSINTSDTVSLRNMINASDPVQMAQVLPSDDQVNREMLQQSSIYQKNNYGGINQFMTQPDPGSLISIVA